MHPNHLVLYSLSLLIALQDCVSATTLPFNQCLTSEPTRPSGSVRCANKHVKWLPPTNGYQERSGPILESYNGLTIDECRRRCASHPQCQSAEFPGGVCYLNGARTILVSRTGGVFLDFECCDGSESNGNGSPSSSSSLCNMGRVIGGVDASPGQVPWQAGIRYRGGHTCGGTIVSEYWVVSAAHCFYKQPYADQYTVRVGDIDRHVKEANEVEFAVEELLLHPKYVPDGFRQFDYDVALLRVRPINRRGIIFGCGIGRLSLAKRNEKPAPNVKCIVSGWGQTMREQTGVLQVAEIPWIPREQCNQLYINRITERMTCAAYLQGGVDSCRGDSGGPLACVVNGELKLWGVTSWGNGCAEANSPGVYAKVNSMLDWLNIYLPRPEMPRRPDGNAAPANIYPPNSQTRLTSHSSTVYVITFSFAILLSGAGLLSA